MNKRTVLVSGIPESITRNDLMIYFQSKRNSGGGDIESLEYTKAGKASITFGVEGAANEIAKKRHELQGYTLIVQLASDHKEEEPEDLGSTSVMVSGISSRTTADALENYFENKRRSSGGDVKEVRFFGDNKAIVTFESSETVKRVLEWGKHSLDQQPLTVSNIKPDRPRKITPTAAEDQLSEERSRVVRISGISEKTTKDALLNFFENRRRSGGGEIEDIQYFQEERLADITFFSAKDAERVSQKHNLLLDGAQLTLTLKELPKVIPKDDYKLHVMGLSVATTKDGLLSFMEVVSGEEVRDIFFGSNSNAMVSFKEPPDLEKIQKKSSTRALDGSHVTIEQVNICDCIEVTELGPKITHDTILFYFENSRQSGGGDVKKVDYAEGETIALVFFEEPSVVDSVVHRQHIINRVKVKVAPYYPFLGEISENPGSGKKEKQLKVDPQTMAFIMKFFDVEFQNLLQESQATYTWDTESEDVVLCSTDKKVEKTKWEKHCTAIEEYIHQVITHKVTTSQEAFHELIEQARDKLSLYKDRVEIECKEKKLLFLLRGKKEDVEQLAEQLDDLNEEIKKKIEYEKTKTIESIEISKPQVDLLTFMNFFENLKNQYKDLETTIAKKESKVYFKGPDQVVRAGNTAVWQTLAKLKEQVMELPKSIVTILALDAGNEFISQQFKTKHIDAVLSFEDTGDTNILVIAVNRKDVNRAVELIKKVTAEESVPLEQDQKPLTDSEGWKDLIDNLNKSFLLKITTELSVSTVWIAGIRNYVDKAKSNIMEFLEKNTIINKFIETNSGQNALLGRYQKSAIEKIEERLKEQSVQIKLDDNDEKISIRGTTEGTKMAVKEVQKLVDQVKQLHIDLDKPGMKKLFNERKGKKLLFIIENEHKCIIELRTNAQNKITTRGEEKLSCKPICSYVTPEGKKIIIFKGDLTEHNVDVMVNAANQRLQHVGGLAKAIVQKGGREIQTECDDFLLRNGRVLDGDVVATSPGKLPCKRLVHAVGPTWSANPSKKKYTDDETKEELILSQTVFNALDEAKNFKSVALPAISAGIFGFPADICAKTVMNSILEYSEGNPNSKLSEIHIVDMNEDVIKAFTKEMRTRFSKETSFTDNVGTPKVESGKAKEGKIRSKRKRTSDVIEEKPSARAGSPTFEESTTSTHGIKIDVIIGDLAKEESQVIVNTVSSDLDLSKNPCAKALSQAAGPGLQQECKGKGPLKAGNMVVTDGYSLGCKNVFHVVAGGWENGKMLRSLLNTCLTEAEIRGFSSIAFPAIGTGNLGFPRDIVAKIFFEEVDTFKKKHPQTSVLEVHIVLFHKDIPTIQAFKNEQKNREMPNKENQRTLLKSDKFQKEETPIETDDITNAMIGSVRVELVAGDITKEKVDAVATLSNQSLSLTVGGGVGTAIARAGGKSIEDECKQFGPQRPGSVVITSAGSLPSNKVLHLISESYKADDVTDIVVKCFKKAESNGISSIAIPAIGTGNASIRPKEAAKALLKAVQKFCKTEPLAVKLIRIVVFQENMLQYFYSAIEDLVKTESGGFWSWLKGSIMSFWRSEGSTPKSIGSLDPETTMSQMAHESGVVINLNDRMWLMIFASNIQQLNAADRAIKELISEHSKKKHVDNPVINELSQEQEDRITGLRFKHSTEIEIKKRIGRIIISGISEDVSETLEEIYKILNEQAEEEHKRKYAELVAKNVQWYFKQDGYVEEAYDDEDNAKIEQAYLENKPTILLTDKDDYGNLQFFRIDFASMTETNVDNNKKAIVSRKELGTGIPLPSHWEPQPKDSNGKEKDIHLVQLDPNNDKTVYDDVQSAITKTSAINILKIERVQNPELYRAYMVKKLKMDEKDGSKEKKLFHGTPVNKCMLINQNGFNRSYCGKNATVYGKGVYFARDASYSMRSTYSPPDSTGKRCMYLVSVLVGEYTLGKEEMIAPPQKSPNNPTITYDSTVDDVNNPSIFVAYRDNQVYPDYLITFK